MMKRLLFLTGAVVALLAVSCTKAPQEIAQSPGGENMFYASIEDGTDTKVFADEKLRVLWDEDDRISVFNRYTLNEQYRFTGKTGDNSGWFEKVKTDGFMVGNELDLVYAVYPFRESTSISNDGILAVEYPQEQSFREGSFGPGANLMVSVAKDERLLFRNACGYLVLKLYGEGVNVASITLQGSFGEPIAGKALLKMEPEGVPSLKMGENAASTVTLVCKEPVSLGAKPEEAVEFWFAIAPVTFEKGFTVLVTDSEGKEFAQFTKRKVEVPRNRKVSMAPFGLKSDTPGFVTIDRKTVCTLTSVSGGDTSDGYQKWAFYTDKDVRVRMNSWRCRCNTLEHIGYHLTLVDLDIPGVSSLYIPLERTTGDDYISGNKSVAGAHLNDYRITEGGTHLDFDLTITLYQETDGDIRIVYSGPVTSNVIPPIPADPAACGPFGGVYLSMGYLTKTADGYAITGNDQLEILKYRGREDVTATPSHFIQFADMPKSSVLGFYVPGEWDDILGFEAKLAQNAYAGEITQKLRKGAMVNGIEEQLFAKVTVDLTQSEYESFSPTGDGKVTGLLLFPDGAVIQCEDITVTDVPNDRFTVTLSYETLLSLCSGNQGCAFLPCTGYYDDYYVNAPWVIGVDDPLSGPSFVGIYRSTSMGDCTFGPQWIMTGDGPWVDYGAYIPVRMIKRVN